MKARSSIGTAMLGQRVLEEEHVPRPPELVVGEERAGEGGRRGHGHRDQATPRGGRLVDRGVGRQRTPVVADEHGIVAAAEGGVQRAGVEAEHGALVVAVRRARRSGRTPAARGRRRGSRPPPARAAGAATSTPNRGSRAGTGRAARRARRRRGRRNRGRWPRREPWVTAPVPDSVMAGDGTRTGRARRRPAPAVIVVTPSPSVVRVWITSPERSWRTEGKPC